jgi:hypothetical protein
MQQGRSGRRLDAYKVSRQRRQYRQPEHCNERTLRARNNKLSGTHDDVVTDQDVAPFRRCPSRIRVISSGPKIA